jgi:hypothetical protein
MLKRLLGSALRARSYWSQCREILLRTITLNIAILRRLQGFYRAGLTVLISPFDFSTSETPFERLTAGSDRKMKQVPPRQLDPTLIYYPFTDQFYRRVRMTLISMMGIGILIWAFAGLPRGALVASLALLPLYLPVELLGRLYRKARRQAVESGTAIDAKVVGKRTTSLGPLHRLALEYVNGGRLVRASTLVPYDVFVRFRVGDTIKAICAGTTLIVCSDSQVR